MADQRLIPESIRDASTLAFNELIERLGTLDITPLLVYLIDDVPTTALPHLAEQFHVTGNEGWLLAASDAERRALIKNSIELHRYKGTPYAIKKVLETLNLTGTVQEWFQYAGAPYHFRVGVIITDGRAVTSGDLDVLLAMIAEYKNMRSQVDAVSLTAVQPGAMYIAIGSVIGITVTTVPDSPIQDVVAVTNLASPQPVGAVITFTATATPRVSRSTEYQLFVLHPVTGVWTTLPYTTGPIVWDTTGLPAGLWPIQIWARNVGSTAGYDAYTTMVFTLQ